MGSTGKMSGMKQARSFCSPEEEVHSVERLLEIARKKLQLVALKRERDELVELVNSPSTMTEEKKALTKERLREIGAIPKLAFCRLENFRILKVLGLGTFGKVFLVRLKSHRLISEDLYPHFFPQYSKFLGPEPKRLPDGLAEESPASSKYWLPPNKLYPETDAFQNYYAMKVVPKHLILRHSNDICHLQTELRTLKKMDHPFIVRLISSFQTKQKVFFITDYYPGGDLFTLLEEVKWLSESSTRFYMAEIILAIEYLHNLSIIYRDLKPENIVLDNDGHCRLVDLGLCKEKVALGDNRCMTRCGTVSYMAPEVHRCSGHGRAADFWSLGALAYDMMCCDYPVHNQDYSEPIEFPRTLSRDATSLLQGLLRRDKTKRLGAYKVTSEGDASGGAEDVKKHPFFKRILDWDDVLFKKLKPPYRPDVKCPIDGPSYYNNSTTYPSVSFSSKYDIVHEKQKHFESFNYVNQKFFHDF